MTDFKEPEIIRSETIIVKSVSKNQYGDLMVNDKLKVGAKRSKLFDVFQEGAEVKIGYATYMNKEYIATAMQTGVHKVEVKAEVKAEEPPKTVLTKETLSGDDTKNRAVCISYSKDLVMAGKIELKDITTYADKFLAYITKKEVRSLVEEAKKMGGKEVT